MTTREFLQILADKDAEIKVLAQVATRGGSISEYDYALKERAEFINSFTLVKKEEK